MLQGSLRLASVLKFVLTFEVPRPKKRPKAPWHVLITLSNACFFVVYCSLTLDHLWENVERKGTLHTWHWTRGETLCQAQGSLACIDSHSRTHVFFCCLLQSNFGSFVAKRGKKRHGRDLQCHETTTGMLKLTVLRGKAREGRQMKLRLAFI